MRLFSKRCRRGSKPGCASIGEAEGSGPAAERVRRRCLFQPGRAVKLALALVLAIGALFVARSCRSDIDREMATTLKRLRSELNPLNLEVSRTPSESLRKYLRFYSLEFQNADHFIGTFESGPHTLTGQVFKPAQSKAGVILSHGYYDHTGVWKHLIGHLVQDGFIVAALDYPGHGLSGGARATIGSFSDYSTALRDFAAICGKELPGTWHLLAHSMGCSAVLNCTLKQEPLPVDKIVLLAPLVRSKAWLVSGVGNKLAGGLVDSVPRVFRDNSSDPSFLKFHKRDPLQARKLPLQWVNAHRAWVADVHQTKPSLRPVKIIQGDSDTTVDWKYNVQFLREKLPNAEVLLLRDLGHQLINDTASNRAKVLETVSDWLAPD